MTHLYCHQLPKSISYIIGILYYNYEVTIGVELGVSVRVYMCRLASVSTWVDV